MAVFIAAEFKIFIGFRDIYNCYKLFVKILRKVFVLFRLYVYIEINMVYKQYLQLKDYY